MTELGAANPVRNASNLSFFESAPIGAALLDQEGAVVAWNQSACQTTGRKPREVMGVPLAEALLARNGERCIRAFEEFCKGGASNGLTLLHCRSLKNSRRSMSYEVSFAGAAGEADSYFAIAYFRDVTAQLALEKQLKKSQKQAEEAGRAKTYFLANMSHEIRTPLSAVLGYVDLIASGDGSAEERWSWAHRIRSNSENLKNLIDDILDISCLEAGNIKVNVESINLALLLQEMQQSFALLAQQKQLHLKLFIDPELPKIVKSDPSRIRQVLTSLVGNAIKFTEAGDVRIRVHLGDEENGRQLVFDVEDTGSGLSRKDVLGLFRPFMQADVKYTRRHGGSGVGLALAQRLARALGGDLCVLKTERGVGTIFRFELPAEVLDLGSAKIEHAGEQPELPSISPHLPPDLHGTRVLLVEDSEDNQILIQRMLAKAGVQVDVANNGKEGLEMALRGSYSLVLMDIQMPVMDGYEAQRRLKSLGYTRPIIAFTAHSLGAEVEKTRASGFYSHLTKPVNKQRLYQLVEELGQ